MEPKTKEDCLKVIEAIQTELHKNPKNRDLWIQLEHYNSLQLPSEASLILQEAAINLKKAIGDSLGIFKFLDWLFVRTIRFEGIQKGAR